MSRKLDRYKVINIPFSRFSLTRKKENSLADRERVLQQDQDFINRILFDADAGNDASDKNVEMLAVPASLHEKLLAIPERENQKNFRQKIITGGIAVAASILVFTVVNNMPSEHRSPGNSDIVQAQRELAIAFQYLNRAHAKAGREVMKTMGENLQDAVVRSVLLPVQT